MTYRFYVYIVASQRNGTLYVGVTNNLARRMCEHRDKLIPGFTSDYNVHRLVWWEEHRYINQAIQREKSLKKWPRKWKLALIEAANPFWDDLYSSLML